MSTGQVILSYLIWWFFDRYSFVVHALWWALPWNKMIFTLPSHSPKSIHSSMTQASLTLIFPSFLTNWLSHLLVHESVYIHSWRGEREKEKKRGRKEKERLKYWVVTSWEHLSNQSAVAGIAYSHTAPTKASENPKDKYFVSYLKYLSGKIILIFNLLHIWLLWHAHKSSSLKFPAN